MMLEDDMIIYKDKIAVMQMKWDDSGWYKWNESEMKYISQVREPEEDIGQCRGQESIAAL